MPKSTRWTLKRDLETAEKHLDRAAYFISKVADYDPVHHPEFVENLGAIVYVLLQISDDIAKLREAL